jgi:hypothetical protein
VYSCQLALVEEVPVAEERVQRVNPLRFVSSDEILLLNRGLANSL